MELASAYAIKRLVQPTTWQEILAATDQRVEADEPSGFTTLIGLCATETTIVGASVGDSKVILVTGNGVLELTRNQTKNPPMGSGRSQPIGFAAMPTAPWRLVAMTDGAWKFAAWETVLQLAREATTDEFIHGLEAAVRLPTGNLNDDLTVMVIET
jgi:PPM family protein phosphatase